MYVVTLSLVYETLGQPRRHLLQSGWSVFVSSKRLVAGDAFIFLRSVISIAFWSMPYFSCLALSVVWLAEVRMVNYVLE